jgi:hypothetical protein
MRAAVVECLRQTTIYGHIGRGINGGLARMAAGVLAVTRLTVMTCVNSGRMACVLVRHLPFEGCGNTRRGGASLHGPEPVGDSISRHQHRRLANSEEPVT